MERDPSPYGSSQFRDSHPVCSGQGSFPLTCRQTAGTLASLQPLPAPSLPHAPAALWTPLNPWAARALSFHAARRRLPSTSAATPPTQPPLLGATSARGRCRKRSRVIPGSSAKPRPRPQEPNAHPPHGTPPSCRASCHMTHLWGRVQRGVACGAPRDAGVVGEAGSGSRDNGAKMAAGGLSARCGAAAARAEGTRRQHGGGPGSRLRADPAPRDRGPGGAGGEGTRGAGPGGFNCGEARVGLAPPPPRARGEAPPPPLRDPQGPPGPKGRSDGGCCGYLIVSHEMRLGRTPWEP